jgi:superfamily II DNA/RNA helicase
MLRFSSLTFKELLGPNSGEYLINNLKNMGIMKPSSVQNMLVPLVYSRTDVILKDMTGSGKTIGLVLGALSRKQQQLLSQRQLAKMDSELQKFAKRRLADSSFIEILFIVPTR